MEDLIQTLGEKVDKLEKPKISEEQLLKLKEENERLKSRMKLVDRDFEVMKEFSSGYEEQKEQLLDRIKALERENEGRTFLEFLEIRLEWGKEVSEVKAENDRLSFKMKKSMDGMKSREKELEEIIELKNQRISELLAEIEMLKSLQSKE